MHFSKKLSRLSPTGPEFSGFGSQCLAKFQPILDCFIPNFKYEDTGNIKTECVDTVVFNLDQIKQERTFLGHPVHDLRPLSFMYDSQDDFALILFHIYFTPSSELPRGGGHFNVT